MVGPVWLRNGKFRVDGLFMEEDKFTKPRNAGSADKSGGVKGVLQVPKMGIEHTEITTRNHNR